MEWRTSQVCDKTFEEETFLWPTAHGCPDELFQCQGKDVTIAIMKVMNGMKQTKYFHLA